MKLLPVLLLTVTFAVAAEVEPVPADKLAKISRKMVAALGSPSDAPFATDVDPEKSAGIKGGGDAGLLLIPDRKLTAEAVASVGTGVTAVGQLWMRNIVPVVNSNSPDPAKLRSVSVRDGDQEAKVEVYFLGVRKTEAGALELALYGREKVALVTIPLVKTDAAASATPVALDGHKEGENAGVLIVTVFGSYKADVMVTKPRE